MSYACDAVLMVAFGGPTKPEEIRPFLAHVLRGRPVPPDRLESVAHHYEVIGGRSPLNDITERQRARLQDSLRARGITLPVALGMRHANPFIAEVLGQLTARGARNILVVVVAGLHDTVTVERYMQAVREAAAELGAEITLRVCAGLSDHPGYLQANVEHIRAAYAKLPAELRQGAQLVFTAHSVPTQVGIDSGYVALFEDVAKRAAAQLGVSDYRLGYQSRSGSPREPWLEPDIGKVLTELAAAGKKAVVVSPIGFVCDHVEVLYDLDIEASNIAAQVGLVMARASTANDHPAYIDALTERVCDALDAAAK